MTFKLGAFILITASVCTLNGCTPSQDSKAPDTKVSGPKYPLIETAWSMAGNGGGIEGPFGNIILTEETDPKKEGTININTSQKIAVDLTKNAFVWRTPSVKSGSAFDLSKISAQKVLGYKKHILMRTIDNNVFAFEVLSESGTVTKTMQTPSGLNDYIGYDLSMVNAGNLLVVPTLEDLYVYDADQLIDDQVADVKPIWTKKYPSKNRNGVAGAAPFVVGGVSYDDSKKLIYVPVSTDDGQRKRVILYAYRPDGSEAWNRSLFDEPKDANTRPPPLTLSATEEGKVVTSMYSGELIAFDATGNKLWATKNTCENFSGALDYLAAQNGAVVTMPGGGSCFASYNLTDGSKNWEFSPPENKYSFASRFTVLRGVVYASNGFLWAVDEASGKLLGRSRETSANPENGSFGAYLAAGTVIYDPPRDQLLLWGFKLFAFKPIK